MTTRLNSTIWLTCAPRVIPLEPARRSPVAIFGRVLALLGATAAFGFSTIASAPHADPAKIALAAASEGRTKESSRLPSWSPSRPRHDAQEAAAIDPTSPANLFRAKAFAPDARFTTAALAAPAANAFVPRPAREPESEWKVEDFARVEVVDGRTLQAGGTRIRLVGIDLPLPEQVCRTLDGRLEPCATRAATQLELLTRYRQVTCHYRLEGAGEAIGRCRLGTSDLTERMVKTGYAWRSAAAPRS
jgi:endonuclease YncB( thermonuclease family)